MPVKIIHKGGKGSGHYGHAGRPGKRGGSSSSSFAMSLRTGKDAKARQAAASGKQVGPGGGGSVPTTYVLNDITRVDESNEQAHTFMNGAVEDTFPKFQPHAYEDNSYEESMHRHKLRQNPGKESWQIASSDIRAEVKKDIIDDVASKSGANPEQVNDILGAWANSSNDDDSLAFQKQIASEFGLELSPWQQEFSVYPSRFNDGGKIARAMYNNTQAKFAAQGFKPNDTITLFRGMEGETRTTQPQGSTVKYSGNLIESWSVSRSEARKFAIGWSSTRNSEMPGNVFAMNVPVKNIFSTAATGLGCLTEGECVIFGTAGDNEAFVAH